MALITAEIRGMLEIANYWDEEAWGHVSQGM